MTSNPGTNQSVASDDTDSENFKLGAFVAKRDISRRISGGLGVGKDVVRDEVFKKGFSKKLKRWRKYT